MTDLGLIVFLVLLLLESVQIFLLLYSMGVALDGKE